MFVINVFMKKLYDKQAVISTVVIFSLAFVYQQTGSALPLGLIVLFVGALLQSVYDMYKHDKNYDQRLIPLYFAPLTFFNQLSLGRLLLV